VLLKGLAENSNLELEGFPIFGPLQVVFFGIFRTLMQAGVTTPRPNAQITVRNRHLACCPRTRNRAPIVLFGASIEFMGQASHCRAVHE
jgi:hypothetical protein